MRAKSSLLYSTLLLSLVSFESNAWGASQPSADINHDGVVGAVDLSVWTGQLKTFVTPFTGADIDGSGVVDVICDFVAIMEQWSGTSSSTATVSAVYSSTTGMGSVTVMPSGGSGPFGGSLGVSGIYLVNDTNTITTGPAITGSSIVSQVPAFGPFGFSASANSDSMIGSGDLVGVGTAPTSTTFSVPAATPISDLQFFYQRIGQAAIPIPIFDMDNNTTFTTPDPFSCSCIVPEPSTSCLLAAAACLCIGRSRSAHLERA